MSSTVTDSSASDARNKRKREQDAALKDALRRFRLGDHVSDPELKLLIKLFRRLNQDLLIMGPHYQLAWRAIGHDLRCAEGYARHRNLTVK